MILPRRERTRAPGFPIHLWDPAEGRGASVTPVVSRVAPIGVDRSPAPPTSFGVLASSSSGNCSVLLHGRGKNRRVTLIDGGISPTRTRKFLESQRLDLERIDDVVFTHLDHDHCHGGWIKALPRHARFRIYRGHRGRAKRAGLLRRRTHLFDDEAFELRGGVMVTPQILDHDELGVAVFRFDFAGGEACSLGYATDLGRPTSGLIESLGGVDVLAIESNYCPRLQVGSDRPEFLKTRIMGGAGHLSNEECRAAVAAIGPKREVVLLHLSRECNAPALAARYHEGASYGVTVAEADRPTGLISLVG